VCWVCSSDGGDKKYIKNFDEKRSWNKAKWKTRWGVILGNQIVMTELDGTESGPCLMAGFGINGVELSGSTTTELVC
jgi:hypothetical protein